MTAKKEHHGHNLVRSLLGLAILTFLVLTLVTIGTTRMSNNEGHNAIFGSFESIGAAIVLIGFPYLCLQILRFYNDYQHMPTREK